MNFRAPRTLIGDRRDSLKATTGQDDGPYLFPEEPGITLPARFRYLKARPALKALSDEMQALRILLNLKHQTARPCRRLSRRLFGFIERFLESGFESMKTLAETLSSWIEPIARMWRFTKNNGITEGFHRKMKLIQRRAYGFRNFENYRIRVIAHCG